MKPIDYRNATFSDLQAKLSGLRERVFSAWQIHGPCTTEDLAEKSGISILTLRPRTTELYQLGFIRLADSDGHSGTYRACSTCETIKQFKAKAAAATDQQTQLAILDE